MRAGLFSVGAAVILVLLGTATAGPQARAAADPASADYGRADAETIRIHVREILADPRYRPHRTFSQWLMEKLWRWDGPHLPQWTGRLVFWGVTIWCVLTLIAILAHLGWTLGLLLRPARGSASAGLPVESGLYENASFEQLWERSAELARAGAFREAIGILLLALLRRLDALKILRFHKSKTNGEYVREYPRQRAARREFVQFVATVERHIYGGGAVPGRTYDTLSMLAKQVLHDVSQNAQV